MALKLAVVGNCQVRVLTSSLQRLLPGAQVAQYFVTVMNDYDSGIDQLNEADVIITDVPPALYPAGTGFRSSSNAPDGRSSSSSFSVHRAA